MDYVELQKQKIENTSYGAEKGPQLATQTHARHTLDGVADTFDFTSLSSYLMSDELSEFDKHYESLSKLVDLVRERILEEDKKN